MTTGQSRERRSQRGAAGMQQGCGRMSLPLKILCFADHVKRDAMGRRATADDRARMLLPSHPVRDSFGA